METLPQLCTSIYRAHKDRQSCKSQCPQEGLEPEGILQQHEVGIALALRGAANSPSEVTTEKSEDAKTGDLPCNTCNHNVDAPLFRATNSGTRSNSATDGLQKKGDEVEGDEGDGVEAWCETRQFFAVYDNDTGEAEIDGC